MFQKVKISVEYLVVPPHYLVVPPRWSVRLTFPFRVRTDGPLRRQWFDHLGLYPHFLRTLWFSLRTCDYPLFHWHFDSILQGRSQRRKLLERDSRLHQSQRAG